MPREEDTEKLVKEVLWYLKLVRHTPHDVFRYLVRSEQFRPRVMQKLGKIYEWTEEDQKALKETIEQMVEEIRHVEAKTLRERYQAITEIIKKHLP